jgi:hypothetical protein
MNKVFIVVPCGYCSDAWCDGYAPQDAVAFATRQEAENFILQKKTKYAIFEIPVNGLE